MYVQIHSTPAYIISDVIVDPCWLVPHFKRDLHTRGDVTLNGVDGEVWFKFFGIPSEPGNIDHLVVLHRGNYRYILCEKRDSRLMFS